MHDITVPLSAGALLAGVCCGKMGSLFRWGHRLIIGAGTARRPVLRRMRTAVASGSLSPLWIAIAALSACLSAPAAVYWEESTASLRVVDYPEVAPCTLPLLLAMDQRHGWGRVSYNPALDLYVVDASLIIGDVYNADTFFQIGTAEHPEEVLVVRGNVGVLPTILPRDFDKINYRGDQIVPSRNQLTLGDPHDDGIATSLLIAGDTNNLRALYVNELRLGTNRYAICGAGGNIAVYNSAITAAGSARGQAIADLMLGNVPVLSNAVLSGVDGFIMAGFERNAVIRNTTFECANSGFYNCAGASVVTGCLLKNLGTAVLDGGGMNLTLRECVLADNNCNWALTHSREGLTLIDCVWTPPRRGDVYRFWDNPQKKIRQYPRLVSRRHIIVQVSDPGGKPIRNAPVEVVNEQNEPDQIDNFKTTTDQQGRTPGRKAEGAILLTEFMKEATDRENEPKLTTYTYTLKVQAAGYRATLISGFSPTQSWDVVAIRLKEM